MKIQTSDLKKLSEKLFNYIIDSVYDFVNISNDFYRHIDKTKIYDPYGEPNLSDCTLGQLSDDWHNL